MGSSRFTWGDTVRVKSCAAVQMRAGECGDVVAITEIDTEKKAEIYDAPFGSTVYQVEFGDGKTVEILEGFLEVVSE